MKKIMFNNRYGLTEAVLSGRKTKTRRIAKVTQEDSDEFRMEYYNATFDALDGADLVTAYLEEKGILPYKVGEVVAVAQCYKDIACGALWDDLKEAYRIEPTKLAGWNNKMFVRADLMPHCIQFTGMHIEQLQDISDEDCIKEGVLYSDKYAMPYGIIDSKAPNGVFYYYSTPREAYADLLDRVLGRDVWRSNPFVCAYDFKIIR